MRFHMGVSFRLKSLKKFLFPILIGLLTYFGLNVFTGFTQVHAGTNLDTYYYMNYEELPSPSDIQLGTHTFQDVLDLINNNNTWDFIPIITYSNTGTIVYQIDLYAFPKNTASFDIVVYGYNAGTSTRAFYLKNSNNVSIKRFINIFNTSSNNSTNDSNFTNLQYSINNNVCSTGCSTTTSNVGYDIQYQSYLLNDNQSYPFFDTTFKIIYSSPFPLTFVQGSTSSSNFYKTLLFNETAVGFGDNFITYYDFTNTSTEPNIEDLQYNQLPWFYYGGISKSDIGLFKSDFSFNYIEEDFVNSLSPSIYYFGRIDHNDYYTYERIQCTANSGRLLDKTLDTDNNKLTATFLPLGFSCSSSLTNYDKIYINVRWVYGNYQPNISNLKVSSSKGYYNVLNPSRASYNGSLIYEKFDNLASNFQVLLSTDTTFSRAYFESTSAYVCGSQVSRNNKDVSRLCQSQELLFGIESNTYGLIYNNPNYYNDNVDLFLYLEEDTLVSISTNDNFYYYDTNGNITNGNIINTYNDNYTANDLDYWFKEIDDYFNSLREDIIELHNLVQTLYDNIPLLYKTFIFISFMIILIYGLYVEIKR